MSNLKKPGVRVPRRSVSSSAEQVRSAERGVSLRGFFEGGQLPESPEKKSQVALLLIDVINDLEFDGGEVLLPHALKMARNLTRLIARARVHGVPVVYANDNLGRLRSDFSPLLKHCIKDGVRGEKVARLLSPGSDDYLVLKHKESGFFSTTLDTLLLYLGTDTLIIGGIATDMCVFSTAKDAYIRNFRIFVPSDCVAAEDNRISEDALAHMQRVLKADIRPSREIDFQLLLNPADDPLNSH